MWIKKTEWVTRAEKRGATKVKRLQENGWQLTMFTKKAENHRML